MCIQLDGTGGDDQSDCYNKARFLTNRRNLFSMSPSQELTKTLPSERGRQGREMWQRMINELMIKQK